MEKLLVTIEVPSVEQSFDLVVPETLTPQLLIQLLYQLLYQLLAELTGNAYVPSGTELLCRREDRSVLPIDLPLNEIGIRMGDHLILF